MRSARRRACDDGGQGYQHPVGRGCDKETGARRLAKIQEFLPDLQTTLRVGFVAPPERPKKGVAAIQWVKGSPLKKAVSDAAEKAYSSMLAEDIPELKELYEAAA